MPNQLAQIELIAGRKNTGEPLIIDSATYDGNGLRIWESNKSDELDQAKKASQLREIILSAYPTYALGLLTELTQLDYFKPTHSIL